MMLRIAQILYSKAHWIFEDEIMPDYPPDAEGNPIVLVDITDKPEVEEGWDYDSETGEFTEPEYTEPEEVIEEPDMMEQLLFETQYQTMLLEMGGM